MAGNWHHLSLEQTLVELETGGEGLSEQQASERLARHGLNRLPEPPRRGVLTRFLLQFHNILIYVLLVAAGITALLDHLIDTSVILAVVVANAIIGFIQEGKAEKAMDAIRRMLAPRASVLRGGERRTVAGEELVPGDVVLLEAGDKVPADLRLLSVHGLQIQEAILTGESVPVDKQLKPVAESAALGDRACMAFSGTTVTSGQGRGVVVAVGGETEIGRVSGLLGGVATLTTPLVEQMDVFAKWLTGFILGVATLILAFGYFIQQRDFSELFMAVVGLSVAAIPEGLPAVLTITLAVGVQAMARRNAIVRRLPAIETLGSVSVICSDKTGTLTRNEMAVATALLDGERLNVESRGYAPVGAVTREEGEAVTEFSPRLLNLARAGVLCSDAELRRHGDEWSVEGDPMEGALLAFAAKLGLSVREIRQDWQRIDVIPFDSKYKFMASLDRDPDGRRFIFLKGAPERLLGMCRQQRDADGRDRPLDREGWQQRADETAALGQRVLALGCKPAASEAVSLQLSDLESGEPVLLGMVGLIDPPRAEAIEAVAECHRAGIRVKMITGDHGATAAAIGRALGLRNPDQVLTGQDLDQLDDTALTRQVVESDIFARTTPEHKLRLVMALQARGMTVAMTGDGVNDAPALKRADAGIAMGLKGSEAAKEAAELVLADDNFASIVAAVREGRTVYDNIKKVIGWTLPTNAGEASAIILALLFNMMLPITPIQILWVNMITAVSLGIALAFEPTEAHTMRRPPRPRNEPLLSGTLIWQILLVASLFLVGIFGVYAHAMERGYSLDLARTMAMNTLVVMEIFYLFFIRNLYTTDLTWESVRGNKPTWIAVGIVIVSQLALTYLPALQAVFDTEAIGPADGLLIISVGALMFLIIEMEKQIRIRYQRRQRE